MELSHEGQPPQLQPQQQLPPPQLQQQLQQQGYVDSMQRIWWDLHFLYNAMSAAGDKRSKKDWN
eukprot:8518343-Lingulodinium_polyedra.AAC.1